MSDLRGALKKRNIGIWYGLLVFQYFQLYDKKLQFILLYWRNPITERHCTFSNNGRVDNGQNVGNLDYIKEKWVELGNIHVGD